MFPLFSTPKKEENTAESGKIQHDVSAVAEWRVEQLHEVVMSLPPAKLRRARMCCWSDMLYAVIYVYNNVRLKYAKVCHQQFIKSREGRGRGSKHNWHLKFKLMGKCVEWFINLANSCAEQVDNKAKNM